MELEPVQILFTYGPFALLFLFIYVIEGKARATLKDPYMPRWAGVTIYVASWIITFALCGAVVYIWMVFNVTTEATITGTIENLDLAQQIASPQEGFYLRHSYTHGDRYDYQWRLITPRRLNDGHKVQLDVAASPDAIPQRYEFAVQPSFYKTPPVIRYVPATQKLVLVQDGGSQELSTTAASIRLIPPPFFQLVASVFAQVTQGPPSPATVYQRLDAVDPVLRRNARDEIIARGKSELSGLEQVLLNPASSVRLRVGALSAINAMPGIDGDKLSDAAYVNIVGAAAAGDPALAAEAYRFFERYSVAGTADLPASTPRTNLQVRAKNPKDGDFVFVFKLAQQSQNRVLVQLNDIQVFEDSSVGKTHWLFDVLVDNKKIFGLPDREYADNPGPKTYHLTAADKASATVQVQGKGIKLSVIGYKPKNVPKPARS